MNIPATLPTERFAARQHVPLALLSAWLILTSPWLDLRRGIPTGAGFFDYAHLLVGGVTACVAVMYAFGCLRNAGWQTYFPWLSGRFAAARRDVGDLLQGRLPGAEGGGLFSIIEGLLLACLLATAASGIAWLFTQGTPQALDLRSFHVAASRCVIGLLLGHVVTVSLHLVGLIRD